MKQEHLEEMYRTTLSSPLYWQDIGEGLFYAAECLWKQHCLVYDLPDDALYQPEL